MDTVLFDRPTIGRLTSLGKLLIVGVKLVMTIIALIHTMMP
jgi:hypothetical protein